MGGKPKDTGADSQNVLDDLMSAYERSLINEALRKAHGNATGAAEMLGTTPRIIHLRILKYQIDVKEFFRKGKREKRRKKPEDDGGPYVRMQE